MLNLIDLTDLACILSSDYKNLSDFVWIFFYFKVFCSMLRWHSYFVNFF